MKKILTLTLTMVFIPILLLSCAKQNSLYSEKKRYQMRSDANIIIEAVYIKPFTIQKREQLDIMEGRKGMSSQIQKGLQFKTKNVLKGNFTKKQFIVGSDIPSIAFGIGPTEYSGKKNYTLYLLKDSSVDKDMLIGAEWESID